MRRMILGLWSWPREAGSGNRAPTPTSIPESDPGRTTPLHLIVQTPLVEFPAPAINKSTSLLP